MAGVRRSDFSEAMKKDMYGYYLDWEKYEEIAPVYEQIFDIVPSSAAYEKFNSAIGLGDLLEKPEGEDLKADAPLEGYTIYCKNRTYGRMVRFTMEHVQDNQKFPDFLKTVVGTWKESLIRTKDRFYVNFFNSGALTAGHDVFNNTITGLIDDTSGDVIYDGLPFFDTAHPDKVGGTYSNHTAARALNHDNLETTWETFTADNNRDERGNEIELMPNILLIPPYLKFTSDRILKSTNIPDSADNDINAMQNLVTPMVWQRLSDSDGWFLGALKRGLMGTDRMAPEFDFYQDETSKDYYATVIYRFGGCVTNWRFWYACNVAAS
jgi:hypothetical protein